jgi:ketosteroid isomerase-like protein
MQRASLFLALALIFAFTGQSAITQAAAGDEAAIRSAIDQQADAWNHADIPSFMQIYEDSPETTFIGQNIGKGYNSIMERYKKNYTSREQMGTLTFTHLEVRLLPISCGHAEWAVVTGQFHLERTAKGEAKKDDGVFSLVWRKGPHGWKIILDHTS